MKHILSLLLILLFTLPLVACNLNPPLTNDGSQSPDSSNSTENPAPPASGSEDGNNTLVEKDALELDYFYKGDFACTIVEDEFFIYFGATNGVWKQSKITGEKELLCGVDSPDSLFLTNEHLYFVSSDFTKVFRVNKTGGEAISVFDTTTHPPFPGINFDVRVFDYQVFNDVIYVFNTALSFAFDTKKQEFLDCMPDDYAGSWQLIDGKIYYISHVQETFSLYCYDLSNKQISVLYGEDTPFPKEHIYYDFWMTGEGLVLCQRLPQRMDYITPSGSHLISEDEISALHEKDGILYYVTKESGICTFFAYSLKEKQELYQIELEDYVYGEISVVNGYLYYCSDSAGRALDSTGVCTVKL